MKSFIVYDSGGKILRCGTCADSDFNSQAHGDELVMEGHADDILHIISDSEIVEAQAVDELSESENIAITSKELRIKRNAKLQRSDWTQFPDSPLSDSKKSEWATYRQALRDIPDTYSEATSLDDIIWPTKPE